MKHPIVRTASTRPALRATAAILIAASLAVPAAFADTAAGNGSHSAVPAVWVKKKLDFVYQGITTRFSCDGLESAVKSVLLQLGARKSDLDLHQTGCTMGSGAPEPFPGVAGTFSVLEPASAEGAAASERNGANSSEQGNAASGSAQGHPVKAEWQTVKVDIGPSGADKSGQCELIEQVKRKILPLFNARDVKFESDCFPHQLTIAGATLQVRVLKAADNKGRELARAPRSGTDE